MTDFSHSVIIQKEEIDVSNQIYLLKNSSEKINKNNIGAIVSFVGSVRDINEGDKIMSMFIEHYPEMTEACINKILISSNLKWPIFSARVVHRIGLLTPGENIVFVGVTSSHRKAAFDACEYIMDYLKTRAPFWKKEETEDGSRWVKAKVQDEAILKDWEKKLEN